MAYTLHIQEFSFENNLIRLFTPSDEELRRYFANTPQQKVPQSCPYWGQVWKSSIAVSQYITQNRHLIAGKKILELAAGLGLPSLVMSNYAEWIYCSDIEKDAVEIAQRSAVMNKRENISFHVIDWHNIPNNIRPDIVVLSDINYEPELFDQLYNVLERLMRQRVDIILATPQRLMAKTFITRLLPYAQTTEEILISQSEREEEWISIFLLSMRVQ